MDHRCLHDKKSYWNEQGARCLSSNNDTSLGNKASDINTWANAGPGAMRGLNRMKNRDLNYTSKKHDWCLEMRELLVLACGKYSLDFELREIEHSLCEYDKYERVRLKQGSPRSKYTAPSWA